MLCFSTHTVVTYYTKTQNILYQNTRLYQYTTLNNILRLSICHAYINTQLWLVEISGYAQLKYKRFVTSLAFNAIIVPINLIYKMARINLIYSFNKELYTSK